MWKYHGSKTFILGTFTGSEFFMQMTISVF